MKKALRRLAVVGVSAMMVLTMAGCTRTTKCAVCEEKKECTLYELTLNGEKETSFICDDCKVTVELGAAILGGTLKKK